MKSPLKKKKNFHQIVFGPNTLDNIKNYFVLKSPQHVRKLGKFPEKVILDFKICITFCVFFCLKTHLHIRKMTKPQKFPFYEKHHFFHFQKNCTIEKSDINALKSSSNQKIATNACINSANFAFSARTHLQI